MTDINRLSAVSAVVAGDQWPLWSSANGDTRRASTTALQAFMQANLTFPTLTGQAQFVVQYAAPVATGFTVTLVSTSNNQWLVMSPLATYATGTITFPPVASLVDNQEILIFSTQIVTALTLSGNGATISGSPGFITANGALRFKYNSLASTWYLLDISATPRTVTGSTGLTVTNGNGIAGNPTLTLDATLAGISAVTTAADQLVYSNGVDTFTTAAFTAAGRTLAAGATAAAQATSLGLGTADTPTFGGLTIADAGNVVLNTTTGTKIGTATTQKLGFYNATPVIQQATTGTATGFTAGAGTAVNDASTFTGGVGATAYRLSDVVRALKNLGLMAS